MAAKKKNILILGGFGFIGLNLLEELFSARGYSVVIFDSAPAPAAWADKATCKIYRGDFCREHDLEEVFKENKIDIVVHLVSTTIPTDSNGSEMVYDIESNLVPTVKLLCLMRRLSVPKIIFASSGGTVYGLPQKGLQAGNFAETWSTNPICSHGTVKLAMEKYIQLSGYLYGLEYLILRISNPYGEHHSSSVQGLINVALKNVLAGRPVVVWGDGEVVRDYIYVKDCVKAIRALIDQGISGEIFNVGSGSGYSVNEILTLIKDVAGKFQVKRVHSRKFDVPKAVLDISNLEAAVDFNPTNIKNGIKKTYRWLLRTQPNGR